MRLITQPLKLEDQTFYPFGKPITHTIIVFNASGDIYLKRWCTNIEVGNHKAEEYIVKGYGVAIAHGAQ